MKLPEDLKVRKAYDTPDFHHPLWPAIVLVDDVDKVVVEYGEDGRYSLSEFPPSHHTD